MLKRPDHNIQYSALYRKTGDAWSKVQDLDKLVNNTPTGTAYYADLCIEAVKARKAAKHLEKKLNYMENQRRKHHEERISCHINQTPKPATVD